MSQALATPGTTPKLLVETSRELPLVAVSVALRTGATLDPPGMEGATRLLARLMRRSAAGRSADQNDALVEIMGASLGAEVTHSTVVFQGAVISRSLDRFADFLLEVLTRPALPQDELERLKRETEAELIEGLDDDRGLSVRWFRRRLFAGHPYARSASGSLSGLKNTTLDALKSLYRRILVPENLVISLAGDITRERGEAFASALAAALPSAAAPGDATEHPTVEPGRRLVFVDKPERTQTQDRKSVV